MTEQRSGDTEALTIVLPAPEGRWSDPAVASLVGERFYADVGPYTFAGTVTFASAAGHRDDDTLTGSHVEIRVDEPRWAFTP